MGRRFVPVTTALLAVAVLLSGVRVGRADAVVADLRIAFTGSSTLHRFGGDAAPLMVPVKARSDGTWEANVEVPVASLDTRDERRDVKMRDMLRGQTHPLIRGEFRGIDPATVRRSSRLPFALTIGGVTRPVTARVHDWIDDPGGAAVSFDADVDVSLEAFDLEAPTALLVVRVADAVHVGVHVTVRRMGPTENHRP